MKTRGGKISNRNKNAFPGAHTLGRSHPEPEKEAAVAQAGPKTGRGWQRNFLAGAGLYYVE